MPHNPQHRPSWTWQGRWSLAISWVRHGLFRVASDVRLSKLGRALRLVVAVVVAFQVLRLSCGLRMTTDMAVCFPTAAVLGFLVLEGADERFGSRVSGIAAIWFGSSCWTLLSDVGLRFLSELATGLPLASERRTFVWQALDDVLRRAAAHRLEVAVLALAWAVPLATALTVMSWARAKRMSAAVFAAVLATLLARSVVGARTSAPYIASAIAFVVVPLLVERRGCGGAMVDPDCGGAIVEPDPARRRPGADSSRRDATAAPDVNDE